MRMFLSGSTVIPMIVLNAAMATTLTMAYLTRVRSDEGNDEHEGKEEGLSDDDDDEIKSDVEMKTDPNDPVTTKPTPKAKTPIGSERITIHSSHPLAPPLSPSSPSSPPPSPRPSDTVKDCVSRVFDFPTPHTKNTLTPFTQPPPIISGVNINCLRNEIQFQRLIFRGITNNKNNLVSTFHFAVKNVKVTNAALGNEIYRSCLARTADRGSHFVWMCNWVVSTKKRIGKQEILDKLLALPANTNTITAVYILLTNFDMRKIVGKDAANKAKYTQLSNKIDSIALSSPAAKEVVDKKAFVLRMMRVGGQMPSGDGRKIFIQSPIV